jgi:hypothetical protein
MASFTDAITQFNPYVAQLPVEAMVKVGMQKQAQYEEGYKKIQGEIDRVAGLDIIRDVDKNYLQSKLDELGGNLKTYAAGDFSNFQLVNSVGGMARQVGKDETVQNSVASTAWYRKQQKAIEEARKNGKSSTQNEAWFSEDTNKWFNDSKAGAKFNSEFISYTDLKKKWMDVQKELGATDLSQDLPYYQDSGGRYTDANGNVLPPGSKPIANEVMIQKIFKGKSPQKIKEAIMASMNEDDIRQLNIDSWYHYKGTSADELKGELDVSFKKHKDELSAYISASEKLASLNPSNKEYQAVIQKQLKDARADYDKTIDDYNKTVELINTDPDKYKRNLYTQNALNSFANSFSNYSESIKYVDNPYQIKWQKDRDHSLAVDKAKEDARHNRVTENISYKNYLLNVEKEQRESEKFLEGSSLFNPGGLNQTIVNDITDNPSEAFIQDLDNTKRQLNDVKTNLKNQYFRNKSQDDFNEDYALHLDAYNNGTETNKLWTKFFDNYVDLENFYTSNASLLSEIQASADKKFPQSKRKLLTGVTGVDGEEDDFFGKPYPAPPKLSEREKKHMDLLLRQQVPNFAERQDYVNSELAKRIPNYQPRSLSFNMSDPKRKSFIKQQISMVLGRISTDKEKQETDPRVTKNFNLDKSVQLNNSDGTNYYVTTQGNTAYITLQGSIGNTAVPEQTIKLSNAEFQGMFSQSITSPSQQAFDRIFQIGSTSLDSKFKNSDVLEDDAHTSARYKKIRGNSDRDAFPRVQNYNVKANIFRLPGMDGLPSGDYQSVFYIQVPDGSGGKEWKAYQGPSSPYLENLEKSFNIIDDATIRKSFF